MLNQQYHVVKLGKVAEASLDAQAIDLANQVWKSAHREYDGPSQRWVWDTDIEKAFWDRIAEVCPESIQKF